MYIASVIKLTMINSFYVQKREVFYQAFFFNFYKQLFILLSCLLLKDWSGLCSFLQLYFLYVPCITRTSNHCELCPT